MKRNFALALVIGAFFPSFCGGNIAWDLQTAVLILDNKGYVTSLNLAEGSQVASQQGPAFSLGIDKGPRAAQSIRLEGNRLTVAYDEGGWAEFRVSPYRGFVVFDLANLDVPVSADRLGLFRLALSGRAELAGILNAAYMGSNVVCLMAAQPNVRAFADTVGPIRADNTGCTNEFIRADKDVKVGSHSAQFTATSTRTDTAGWSLRGKSFLTPIDLTGCTAIRAWVRGDGKGALLKIQLSDGANGYRDDYIKLDFKGWKHVDLSTPALNTLRYDRVGTLIFYYNAMPPQQTVSCVIDHVEAIVSRDGKEQAILLEDFESTDSPLWRENNLTLAVETCKRYGLQPAKFGLIACPVSEFPDTIRRFEEATALPSPRLGGVWNKVSPWVKRSYFFLTSFHESQCDEALAIAKQGGFDMILLGQESWCKSTGHYEVNTRSFPGGLDSLRRTIRRFKNAGFHVGLHFLGASIYPPDSYLTPVPDPRLFKGAITSLAADIDENASFIPTPHAPDAFPAEGGGYEGQGTVLQIGDELIVYDSRSTSVPFGFSGCRRGHLGTKPAAHKAGDRIAHLTMSYGYHMYDMDTSLLDEVATHCTRVANACDVDMLYFDGSERLQGDHWYYNARLHKAFYDRLQNKNMLLQASSHSHYSWHIMARSASADGHGDLKGYLDARSGWFDSLAKNLMPLDVGWYYGYDPTSTPDMFEYVLGATLGYQSSMSFQVSVGAAKGHPFTAQILDLIARYEKLRLSGKVPQAVRDRLRIDPALTSVLDPVKGPRVIDKRREYRLIEATGQTALQRVIYEPWHEIGRYDENSCTWKVRVREGPAKVGVQIQAVGGPWLHAGPAYDDHDAVILESFDDLAPYTRNPKEQSKVSTIEPGTAGSTSPGVMQRFESTDKDVRQGSRCGVYTATGSPDAAGGWSVIGKVFDPPLDISWHKGIGLWLRGDAHGGSFKLQIRDTGSGVIDYYITNDFCGWRYQQLARPDKDPLNYAKVGQLLFYYNGLPAKTPVSCGIDDVKALRSLDRRTLVSPGIQVAGKRIGFAGTLVEGQYATLWPGETVQLNGPSSGRPAQPACQADELLLPAGEHAVRFSCQAPLIMGCRVRLTLQPSERYLLGN